MTLQLLLAIAAGIALSTACGFRVFLPMLAASIAIHTGAIKPNVHLSWLGDDVSLVLLTTATIAEILLYRVPWLDHAVDSIATPAAIAAGATLLAATLPDGSMPPAVRWAIALIAGGGTAGAVQAVTVATRAVSTHASGGLLNRHVTKWENIFAAVLSVLAVLAPIVALLLAIALLCGAVALIARRRRMRLALPPQ